MTKLKSLGLFLWNKEEGKCFGRSTRGWGEICSFFIIFYAVLLSYFCGMLSLFFQTIAEREPYLTGDDGFLTTPGIGVRPTLKTGSGQGYTTLIYFTDDRNEKYTKDCINDLKKALQPYKTASNESYAKYWKHCTKSSRPDKLQSCIVNYRLLTSNECQEGKGFSYVEGQPCVLLTLNKIYGWKPDPYTAKDSLPKAVQNTVERYYKQTGPKAPSLVWVHCDGEEDFDKHHLGNDTEYLPEPGFRVSNFPYLNQYRHLQPAIMVKFKKLTPNVAIKVHCKAYAKNVKFDRDTWAGGFHFELFYRKT